MKRRLFGSGGRMVMVLLGVILLWAGPAVAVNLDNTINGTVTLPAGITTGRVYLRVLNSFGGETSFGKSVEVNPAGPTTYAIRGLANGSYVVVGFLDELNRRVPFTTAALGQSGTVTITGNLADGPADLALDYPQATPTATMEGLDIMSGDAKLLVFAKSQRDNLGFLNADQVSLCYGTDQNFLNPPPTCPTNLQNIPIIKREVDTVVSGLENGTTYYFMATPFLNGQPGTPVIGSGTPSLPGGGSTVAGTVNFSGTPPPPGTKVLVAIVNDQIPGVQPAFAFDYFPLNQDGVSADFSVPGVPDGPFFIYALADMNGNDIIDLGELQNTESNTAPLINVAGQDLTGQDVSLTDDPMNVRVTTQHQRLNDVHTYGINIDFSDGSKRPVNIALTGSSQVAFPPMDLALTPWGSYHINLFDLGYRPQPTDTINCSVRYLGDATGGNPYYVSADTVLDAFATPVAPSGYLLNNLRPDFSWTEPANPPFAYQYHFRLANSVNGLYNQLYPPPGSDSQNYMLSGGTTAMAYPLAADLLYDQQYNWDIVVYDLFGNQASVSTPFTPVTQLPGLTRPGLFRAGTWYLDLNNSHTYNTGDISFKFGRAGDIPVPADWNNDGTIVMGLFRAGTWYLDLNDSHVFDTGDLSFKYGQPGDIPVPAAWNNDGIVVPALYRAGTWYIDLNNSHGANIGDISFKYGQATDIPVPATWNNDGIVIPALFRAGTWYIDSDNSHNTSAGDISFKYGRTGDIPVPAEWNNDGNIVPALFRAGTWYLDLNNSHTSDQGDISFKFGQATDKPITIR